MSYAPSDTDAPQGDAQAPAADTPSSAPGPVDQTAAPAQAPAPAEPQTRAPEQYTDFMVPDELRSDAMDFGAFSAVARQLNLSQDDAQTLVTFQTEAIARERAAWAEASRTDPEFGGAKLDENMAVAKKAIDAFGTPHLRELLDRTGLGSHPEVIRAFYRAGKAISDDVILTGTCAPGQSKSHAERLYS